MLRVVAHRPILPVLALLFAGALGMHELRDIATFGTHADHEQGTGRVLVTLAPLVSLLLAGGFAQLLLKTATNVPVDAASRVKQLGPIASAAALLVYATQELLHSILTAGHVTGLHGVFGHGAWIVIPIAFVIGALVAAATRTVRALERRGAPVRVLRLLGPATATLRLHVETLRTPRSVVGSHLAGRGPPVAVA